MGSLNWTGRRRLPLIRQTESAECGLACLAMMASWHGLQTDLPTLRERFSISTQGMTLQRLIECAAGIRLSSRAVRLEPEDLKSLSLPCILHWNMARCTAPVRGHSSAAAAAACPACRNRSGYRRSSYSYDSYPSYSSSGSSGGSHVITVLAVIAKETGQTGLFALPTAVILVVPHTQIRCR